MENRIFVDPDFVKKRIESNLDNLVILDQPYGKYQYSNIKDPNIRDFEQCHIPGAIKITSEEYDNEVLNLKKPVEIEALLLSKGIDHETELIIYSDRIIAACRVAFVAYWAGVKNIYVLKGGIQSWIDAGYEVTNDSSVISVKDEFGCKIPQHPEAVLSTPDDVKNRFEENPNLKLAAVRSWEEFIGATSGYSYIEISGSPMGSVYAEASTDRRNVKKLIKDDGEIGNIDEILNEWKDWGITPNEEVVFYCGAGWRAAAAFFLTKELGWENTKIYDGGWYLWKDYHRENPKDYPIQRGDPRTDEFEIIDYMLE